MHSEEVRQLSKQTRFACGPSGIESAIVNETGKPPNKTKIQHRTGHLETHKHGSSMKELESVCQDLSA